MIMMPVMLLDYVAPPCCLLSCALGVKGVYHVSDDICQLVAVGQQLDGVGLVQYYSVHDNLFKFINFASCFHRGLSSLGWQALIGPLLMHYGAKIMLHFETAKRSWVKMLKTFVAMLRAPVRRSIIE